jgi:hypothetical protein
MMVATRTKEADLTQMNAHIQIGNPELIIGKTDIGDLINNSRLTKIVTTSLDRAIPTTDPGTQALNKIGVGVRNHRNLLTGFPSTPRGQNSLLLLSFLVLKTPNDFLLVSG